MSRKDWRIVICDVPDKEELVAEVHFRNEYWVEISAENPNEFIIQFYQSKERKYWEFPFDEAMQILQEAKEKLGKMQRTPEQQAEYDQLKNQWEEQEKKWEEDKKNKS